MRYIESKIIQSNPNLDLSSINPKDNKSIISPIPRGYNKYGEPIYEDSNSVSYLPESKNGQPLIKDHALSDEDGGRNEIGLIKDLEGVNYVIAKKLSNAYLKSNALSKKYNLKILTKMFQLEEMSDVARKYNWDIKVLKRLQLFKHENELFSIPVINNGVLLTVASYYPARESGKWIYSRGMQGQFIFNYDNWLYDQRPTIISEGAKDMLTLLSLGYNAISLTNGATALPEYYPNSFKNLGTGKNKKVYIVYDNDKAGKDGAKKLAVWLWKNEIKNIKIIDISGVCKNQGDDIWDYFNIYHKTKEDFDNLIDKTYWFSQEDFINVTQNQYPLKTIAEAKRKEHINKIFQTDIEVAGVSSTGEWIIPESVEVKYTKDMSISKISQTATFEIDEKEMFTLMKPFGVQKEKILSTKLQHYATHKKNFIIEEFKKVSEEFISFCEVIQAQPLYSEPEENTSTEYYPCYIIGKRLEENSRYRITYTITANPDSKSESLLIIKEASKLHLVDEGFQLTDEDKEELKEFQPKYNETVDDAINRRLNEMNDYIGNDLEKQKDFWLTTELTYHSVYEYQTEAKDVKTGMLVTLVFGDPGFGKSHIYADLAKLYNRGYHLPANNTTEIALVGGSVTREGGQKVTRGGTLSTLNKGMVVMEEFTHYTNVLLKITDLITSGKALIDRIGGKVNYYAKLRWLFISNTTTGKKIKEEKHALVPLSKLVPTLEWYRRYDIALAVSAENLYNKDGSMNSPVKSSIVTNKKNSLNIHKYQTLIKWVWSRTKEHAIITDELQEYIFNYANKWVKTYGKKLDVVGDNQRIIYIKLCKISFAVATMLFSTEDGINIMLKKEHADWAYNYLVSIYDNDTFNLKAYLKETNQFTLVSDDDIKSLQEMCNKNKDYRNFIELLATLDNSESITSATFKDWWHGDNLSDWRILFQFLCKNKFLQAKPRGFLITDKFIKTYKEIDVDISFDKEKEVKKEIYDF